MFRSFALRTGRRAGIGLVGLALPAVALATDPAVVDLYVQTCTTASALDLHSSASAPRALASSSLWVATDQFGGMNGCDTVSADTNGVLTANLTEAACFGGQDTMCGHGYTLDGSRFAAGAGSSGPNSAKATVVCDVAFSDRRISQFYLASLPDVDIQLEQIVSGSTLTQRLTFSNLGSTDATMTVSRRADVDLDFTSRAACGDETVFNNCNRSTGMAVSDAGNTVYVAFAGSGEGHTAGEPDCLRAGPSETDPGLCDKAMGNVGTSETWTVDVPQGGAPQVVTAVACWGASASEAGCLASASTLSLYPCSSQLDSDGDGWLDGEDNCPDDHNVDQDDQDDDGSGDACDPCIGDDLAEDPDEDGYCSDVDNCATVANATQADTNHDGQGDACEADGDMDGTFDDEDTCPLDFDPDQADSDGDAIGDACDDDRDGDGVANATDNCPDVHNPDQAAFDADGIGDACDGDDDGDGLPDEEDLCPETPSGVIVGTESILAGSSGCSGVQYVALVTGTCASYDHHGDYVSSVTQAANDAKSAGLLTGSEKGAIVSQAAKSCK